MKHVLATMTASIVALSGIAIATPAFAACTIGIPGSPSTASFNQLQLPVDRNGDGKFDTVSGSALQTYNEGASGLFDRQGTGRIVMRVPTQGLATTPNSKYPRTELKENRTWGMSDGCAGLAAKVTIYDPPNNGSIVIGQIHIEEPDGKAPRPPVELYYSNGTIHADILYEHTNESSQPRQKLTIVSNIAVKQTFSYAMTLANNGLLTVTVNGTSRTTYLHSSFYGRRLYFKAGNYTQDTGGGSSVGFDGLAVQHN